MQAVKSTKNEEFKYVEQITPSQRLVAWISRIVLWISILVVIFPVVAVITASLSPGVSFGSSILPEKITFDNYKNVVNNTDFFIWLKNSAIICFSVATIQLALSLPAGFAFSKLKFKFRGSGLMALLILQMFPLTMALPAIQTIAMQIGGMDHLFTIILLLAGGSAYNIWLMKGYMDGIPTDLVEAAYVDGATTFQVFIKIILPLMRNMLLVIFLFSFITAYSEFIFSSTLLKDQGVQTLATGLQGFIKDKFSSNWTTYSAAAIMSSIPIVALFMGLQKYVASGLTAGSVKG